MEMRPYELSLCTAGDYLLTGIIYILDVADGISATKGWAIENIVRWMESLVVHTHRGENVEHVWKYKFFSPLIALLGVIFLENLCLVVKITHKCEACILHTWEQLRTAGNIAANIITDRRRILWISTLVRMCRAIKNTPKIILRTSPGLRVSINSSFF